MKKLLGFIAQKIGLSCSSSNSRNFIDGWFLGSGITVKAWSWQSRSFGKYEWKTCSSSNSRNFIDGWFLGSGITVKAWSWQSRSFGKYEWKIGIAIHSRKDFKFGFSHVEYDCRIGWVFSFGYGAIIISHY